MTNQFVPNNNRYIDQQQKAQLKKGVLLHLRIFLLTSMAIFGANLFTNFHHPYNAWWCLSPILTWGILVVLYSIFVSFFPNLAIKLSDRETQKKNIFNKNKKLTSDLELPLETLLNLKQTEKVKQYNEEDLV